MPEGNTPTRRGTNKLTTKEIEGWLSRQRSGKLRAQEPAWKLTDGDGMYLAVTSAGTAVWRLKFRAPSPDPDKQGQTTEQVFALGSYPETSLADARAARDQARAIIREGRNPIQVRRIERQQAVAASGNTFKSVALEWLAKEKKEWSAVHYEKSERALERDVFPDLGPLPVSEVTPAMITRVVEQIAKRGAVDTARKVRQHIGGIFRLAQAKGLCNYKENPAEPAREVLPKKNKLTRRPALLKWTELGAILRKADKAPITPTVRLAGRLLAFTAVRISNVVEAEWREFHLEDDIPHWIIPRSKMKAQDRHHDHKVILGATIAAELREWKRLNGGRGYVFASTQSSRKHITREALEKAYRESLKLEGKHTPHGWRSAFSTLAREDGDFAQEVVELALDHVHDNEVARAYDRGERLQQRIKLYQWWDSQLAAAERGAEVVPIRKGAAA